MIVLDTHVLIMLVLSPDRLSKAASKAIRQAEARDGIAISSITLWEVALLIHERRIKVDGSIEVFLKQLSELPGLHTFEITAEIAALAFGFEPDFPRDPADRLIAATARSHNVTLVTKDARLQDCPLVRTIW